MCHYLRQGHRNKLLGHLSVSNRIIQLCLNFSYNWVQYFFDRNLIWGSLFKNSKVNGVQTISTFALETETLLKTGHIGLAVLYVALSVFVGVGLAYAGQLVIGK